MNSSLHRDTLMISITNSFTSILAGFVIFSAFGYMSHLQGIPVSDLAVDGEATNQVILTYNYNNDDILHVFGSNLVSSLISFYFQQCNDHCSQYIIKLDKMIGKENTFLCYIV